MVSAVIPVYNQSHLTERCLESLLRNSKLVKEVFVIDNASQDRTPEILDSTAPRFEEMGIQFETIRNEKNLGFGRACNQGIRKASQPFVAVINNDTWLMPAWDEALLKALEMHQLDLVGPYFDETPMDEKIEERADSFVRRNSGKLREHFVPILMFYKKESVGTIAFDHGGIFDERFFVTYEDTDLKYRMDQAGLKYAQSGECYIWHHSMGTRKSPGMIPSDHETEGRQLFMDKWGFDPRPAEHTFSAKMKRRLWKLKEKFGFF